MTEIFNVEVPGAKYSCSKNYQTLPAKAEDWQRLLKSAHGKQAKCLCAGRGSKLLNIRHLKGRDHFFLARFAKTGPEHAFNCRFFSDAESRTGMQSYVEGVVVEGDDNDVKIRLSQAIQIRAKKDTEEPKVDLVLDPHKPGRTQRAMKLLGLLHLLWTRGNLNAWFPKMEGKRDDSILQWNLRKTAEHIKTHRMTLDKVLLCPSEDGRKAGARNCAVVSRAEKLNYRLVAVGVLQPYDSLVHEPLDQMQKLSLMNSTGMPAMYLNGRVWTDAQTSFAKEVAAWKKGGKTIAIVFLERRKNSRYYNVLKVALMRVSEMLIPLDSGLEGKVEALLREQKRAFSKPLRFDDDDKTIPDFWLNDLTDEYPMEVFGMNTPEYLQRKAEKVKHYEATYGKRLGWWHWNAYENSVVESIPMFPSPANVHVAVLTDDPEQL